MTTVRPMRFDLVHNVRPLFSRGLVFLSGIALGAGVGIIAFGAPQTASPPYPARSVARAELVGAYQQFNRLLDAVQRRSVVEAAEAMTDQALTRAHADILAAFVHSIETSRFWATRQLVDYAFIIEHELSRRGLVHSSGSLSAREMAGLFARLGSG